MSTVDQRHGFTKQTIYGSAAVFEHFLLLREEGIEVAPLFCLIEVRPEQTVTDLFLKRQRARRVDESRTGSIYTVGVVRTRQRASERLTQQKAKER
jgi:hypothetical protein